MDIINKIDGNIIIGTGSGSFSHTNHSKIKNKYLWIRGFEIWNVSEDKFINMLKESKTKKLVNSIGLQNKLKKVKELQENFYKMSYANQIIEDIGLKLN